MQAKPARRFALSLSLPRHGVNGNSALKVSTVFRRWGLETGKQRLGLQLDLGTASARTGKGSPAGLLSFSDRGGYGI